MFRNDTAGANDFASDTAHTVVEVDAHWWEFFSGYRLKQWQKELRKYMGRTGVSEKEICEYAGLVYSDAAVFYNRLPKKRETYIGVGMALGQPLDTINRWIRKYGKKRELYVKDITADLVWTTEREVLTRKNLTLTVVRSEGDQFWLWSNTGRIGLVVRILE